MGELSRLDPTGRFTGLAENYARYRPDYPAAALDHIFTTCQLGPGASVVDVGSGTGIFARLLAQRGLRVIGIEPNADMREQARAASDEGVDYREGTAEATGLPDACAAAVFSAQAFHWFDAGRALPEFVRILRPGGSTILVWNERDTGDAFTAAYGAVIRSFAGAAHLEDARQRAGQALMHSPLFGEQSVEHFGNEQTMNEAEMIGRALSVSYAPREAEDIARLRSEMGVVFARFAREGHVTVRYRTSVYRGRKRG